MDSGSENSFAWTDTSSDSFNSSSKDAAEVDSLSFKKGGLNSRHTMKNKEKNRINKNEEECQINIKKENSEVSSNSSHKKKKIKLEPDSDTDKNKQNNRVNDFEINGNQHESQQSGSYDETFLDIKVKQEESTVSTKKKKSKKKRRNSVDSDVSTTSTKLRGRTNNEFNSNSSYSNLPESEPESGKTKSKKKKKKSKEICHKSDGDIEDKLEIGETTICKQDVSYATQNNHSIVNHSLVTDNHSMEDESDESGCNEISAIKCDTDTTHTISFINNSNTSKNPKTVSLNITETTKERTPRISERILFESEDDDNMEDSTKCGDDYNSKKTKQFLKGNPNLKLVSEKNYTNLTQDDEIWILKCPKEIDIRSFAGKNINFHGKCKIKFDGQTYDGNAEGDIQSNTVTVLTMEHNKYKIKNLPLNGIISLRKRIPKAQFHDDNVMVNNQTNFIPLPETKCRHPLFGSNYKKALKIPASIAERLIVQDSIETPLKAEKRKKKKHKSDKNAVDQETPETQEAIMKIEPDITIDASEKKKKKKRKISDDAGPAPKKLKRIKHDPESAEAWDSEKAIEENLFNF